MIYLTTTFRPHKSIQYRMFLCVYVDHDERKRDDNNEIVEKKQAAYIEIKIYMYILHKCVARRL